MEKPKVKYWKIIYIPSFEGSGVVELVYKGTEEQLNSYLTNNHCCSLCQREIDNCNFIDWWHTHCSAEYLVDDVTGEYL